MLGAVAALALVMMASGPAVATTSDEVMASYVQKAKLISATAEPVLAAVAPSDALSNRPGLASYMDPNTGERYEFDAERGFIEEYLDPRVNDQPPTGSGVTTEQVAAQAEALLQRTCGNPALAGVMTMSIERRVVSPAMNAKGVSTPDRSECYVSFNRYVNGIKMPDQAFMIFDGRSGRLVLMSQDFADVRVSLAPAVDRSAAIVIAKRSVDGADPVAHGAELWVHDNFEGTQQLVWVVSVTAKGDTSVRDYEVAVRASDGAVLWGNATW